MFDENVWISNFNLIKEYGSKIRLAVSLTKNTQFTVVNNDLEPCYVLVR